MFALWLACVVPNDLDGDGSPAGLDCNDTDARIFPGADETCDQVDNDCDGTVDEEPTDGGLFHVDADGDGYGGADTAPSCNGLTSADDCDDDDPTVYPQASETCDSRDEDCDGAVDEDVEQPTPWYTDADGDGYGDPATEVGDCEQPSGTIAQGGDCDDTDRDIHPGADETCDGVDQDCDGTPDNDPIDGDTFYVDGDNDGFGDGGAIQACSQPDGYASTDDDCDDNIAGIHPDADETCGNGVDEDCDGSDAVCDLYDDDADLVLTHSHYEVDWRGVDVGDLNGDGAVDLVAGAIRARPVHTDNGEIYVYLGSNSGTIHNTSADATLRSNTGRTTYLGFGVQVVGDVTGNGHADLAFVSSGAGYTSGFIGLLEGPVNGTHDVDTELYWEAQMEGTGAIDALWWLDSGDVNGDGDLDLVATLRSGGSWRGGVVLEGPLGDLQDQTLSTPDTWGSGTYGGYRTLAYDMDGDGVDDLITSGYQNSSTATAGVWIQYGPITGTDIDVTLSGSDGEGWNLAVGDLDGDGTGDVAASTINVQGVWIVSAPTTGDLQSKAVASIHDAEWPGHKIGSALEAGDVDNDSRDDLLVGMGSRHTTATQGGSVYLFYGALSGTYDSTQAQGRIIGEHANGAMGYILGLHDFNGDGQRDLMTDDDDNTELLFFDGANL